MKEMTEVGKMKVTELTKHEDGSATCTFDLDDKTAALAQELGLKLYYTVVPQEQT